MRALSLFHIIVLLCGGVLAARENEDAVREQVQELCLTSYVSGMTEQIANGFQDKIGPSSIMYLEDLLYDCEFPRRDNVVALLGFLSDGEALIHALVDGICNENGPGNNPDHYRVELLLPHALGFVAKRGYKRAKQVLLNSLMEDSKGGALHKAAQRAPNTDNRLIKLAKQALLGLRECAETDDEMALSLKSLASGTVSPAWMPQTESAFNVAESSQHILADISAAANKNATTVNLHNVFTGRSREEPQDDHNNNVFTSRDQWEDTGNEHNATEPQEYVRRRRLADRAGFSYTDRLDLDFAKHADLGNDMTEAELDMGLAAITKIINARCCIVLNRDRPVNRFGSKGDSLDTIGSRSEYERAMYDSTARIKIVDYIGFCGSTSGLNVLGCFTGSNILMVSYSKNYEQIGRIVAHEMGHAVGLGHSSYENRIMYPGFNSNSNRLTSSECRQFHNPISKANITPVRDGSCPRRTSIPKCDGGRVVNFESGKTEGWTSSGSCSEGRFVVGKPQYRRSEVTWSDGSKRYIVTQPNGDHTSGSGYALFTGGNDKDVSGGECIVESPSYYVGAVSSLSLWYFFGQRDGKDDRYDGLRLELSMNNGNTWRDLVQTGDLNSNAIWTEVTVKYIPRRSRVKLRLRVADGANARDAMEAGIDDILICPLPTSPTCIIADFESDNRGWTNNDDLSTCTTGKWTVGSPSRTSSGGVTTQVRGDHTTGNGYAWFTARNSGSAGREDVDKGVCVGESPKYDVEEESDLSVWWYTGQRDPGDDREDYFNLQVSFNNGNSWGNLVSIGDQRFTARWRKAIAKVPRNSDVKFRLLASDGEASGDIIEAGIDDIAICKARKKCTRVVNFEGGMEGWSNSGDCRTGAFVSGTPDRVVSGGTATQVDGDFTKGRSGKALFTARNDRGSGRNDVDGGYCVTESPVYDVNEDSKLFAWYFFGQRNAGDDRNDKFRLEMSTNGGSSWSRLVSIGDRRVRAQWTLTHRDVRAGDKVKLRVRVSDGAATGDLIEAGIDEIRICPK